MGSTFFFLTVFSCIVCLCASFSLWLFVDSSWWYVTSTVVASYLSSFVCSYLYDLPEYIHQNGMTWNNFWWIPFSMSVLSMKTNQREKKEWCKNNCNYSWNYHNFYFRFKSNGDAVAFKIVFPV